MKTSEVKKFEAISIMHDDVTSDELRFQMLRDIFQGYENALLLEQAASRSAEAKAAEEACRHD